MSRRRKVLACFAVFTLTALPPVRAEAPREPEGKAAWRALFDGKSLQGWKHVGPGEFVVEDGMMRTQGGMGLLWYEREKLGDCVLKVVYRTGTERSNSGVYIRIADRPAEPWFAVHHGFEVQIMDGGAGGRGTGSIYTFAQAKSRPAHTNDWNTLEITLKGNLIKTAINGVPVSEFDASGLKPQPQDPKGEADPARGPRPTSGYIGLQNHDANSIVYFREVAVRPLAGTE